MTESFQQSEPSEPAELSIIPIRNFDFEFPQDLDPVWVPQNPYRSHFFNGVSLTMPHLEPFLCKTMREAQRLVGEGQQVEDEQLLEDMKGFIGQEAQHYRCHRRLNERLTANGHPQFAAIEKRISDSYERLSQQSLSKRLAYSAGFECMTNGFTNWILADRKALFENAQNEVTSFWIAHMAEECEHKTVAFDVYERLSGAYWARAAGVLHGSFHVLGLGWLGMVSAVQRDVPEGRLRRMMGIARQLGAVTRKVGPYLLRALHPSYNPRDETEPDWLGQWQSYNAQNENNGPMPVIDTSSPDMGLPAATS